MDEFSLGCVLFEMLTRRTLFDGEDEREIRTNLVAYMYAVTGRKDPWLLSNLPSDVKAPTPLTTIYARLHERYVKGIKSSSEEQAVNEGGDKGKRENVKATRRLEPL